MDETATKTAARGWTKRCREELRYAERCLALGDFEKAAQAFMDASAAAAEGQSIAERLAEK